MTLYCLSCRLLTDYDTMVEIDGKMYCAKCAKKEEPK